MVRRGQVVRSDRARAARSHPVPKGGSTSATTWMVWLEYSGRELVPPASAGLGGLRWGYNFNELVYGTSLDGFVGWIPGGTPAFTDILAPAAGIYRFTWELSGISGSQDPNYPAPTKGIVGFWNEGDTYIHEYVWSTPHNEPEWGPYAVMEPQVPITYSSYRPKEAGESLISAGIENATTGWIDWAVTRPRLYVRYVCDLGDKEGDWWD